MFHTTNQGTLWRPQCALVGGVEHIWDQAIGTMSGRTCCGTEVRETEGHMAQPLHPLDVRLGWSLSLQPSNAEPPCACFCTVSRGAMKGLPVQSLMEGQLVSDHGDTPGSRLWVRLQKGSPQLRLLSHLYGQISQKYQLGGGWAYPSEKYDFVSWDYDIPNIWKLIKFHGSKAPTSQSSRLAAKPTWEVMELIWTHAFENHVPDSEKPFLCGAAFPRFWATPFWSQNQT